jgi:hypothetical protein
MSLTTEEARALDRAADLLLKLSSGQYRFAKPGHTVAELRGEARSIMRHYPLAAGSRWLNVKEATA